jgi:hypothetical protein
VYSSSKVKKQISSNNSSYKKDGYSRLINAGVNVPAERIPVLICIDVEPDEFKVSQRQPDGWRGFEIAHSYFSSLRESLQKATDQPVHFCWFIRMDPQIELAYGSANWAAEHYNKFFRGYLEAGDEIGVHVHTYRWEPSIDGWLDDHGSDDWAYNCLKTGVNAYRESFGKDCESIRFGNYWISTEAINHAEALGLRFDLTVEPGLPPNRVDSRKPHHTGNLPDYYRVPRRPYAPSLTDFRIESSHDDRHIRLMPLTSSHLSFGWGRRGVKKKIARIKNNGFRNRLQDTPLSMWRQWQHPNGFSQMIDRALAAQDKPYLAFAIHSNFPIESGTYPRIDDCIQTLVNHPARSRFVYSTPAEALTILS